MALRPARWADRPHEQTVWPWNDGGAIAKSYNSGKASGHAAGKGREPYDKQWEDKDEGGKYWKPKSYSSGVLEQKCTTPDNSKYEGSGWVNYKYDKQETSSKTYREKKQEESGWTDFKHHSKEGKTENWLELYRESQDEYDKCQDWHEQQRENGTK